MATYEKAKEQLEKREGEREVKLAQNFQDSRAAADK